MLLRCEIFFVYLVGNGEIIIIRADEESMHYVKLVKGKFSLYPLKFVPKNENNDQPVENSDEEN